MWAERWRRVRRLKLEAKQTSARRRKLWDKNDQTRTRRLKPRPRRDGGRVEEERTMNEADTNADEKSNTIKKSSHLKEEVGCFKKSAVSVHVRVRIQC